MRVLVTGAFGNIGTSTVAELVRQGRTVQWLSSPVWVNMIRQTWNTNLAGFAESY